ncbi:MAG: peptidoglycan-binding protein, partial [Clostridia bacterium]
MNKRSFMLFITIVSLLYVISGSIAVSVISKNGSSGSEVRQIQTKLKNWGYYTGSIDGVYGWQTESAVRSFQKKNNLTVDGIAGEKTLQAMGIYSSGSTNSQSESQVYLLAKVINGEARGEPYEGQVAVGAVVLNRVKHPSFPNSISGVVYQKGAFTA